MSKKIITVCKHGLIRSVALADVLKLHFEPVDVIPVGCYSNSYDTLDMLGRWSDHIVFMQSKYQDSFPQEWFYKFIDCDVGPDNYGNSHNRELIDKVWDWCRQHSRELGIKEHNRSI